jgi:hypothetical protein
VKTNYGGIDVMCLVIDVEMPNNDDEEEINDMIPLED